MNIRAPKPIQKTIGHHSFRFIFFREGRNSGRKSPKAKEKGSYSIFFKAKYSWIRAFFVLITKYEHRYLPYFWFSPIRYRKNLRKTSLLLWSTKICSYLLFTLELRCSLFFERKWLFLFYIFLMNLLQLKRRNLPKYIPAKVFREKGRIEEKI